MRPIATGTMTVGNLVKVAAVRYRDKEALFCSSTGRRFTYRQINDRVNRLANGLMNLGLAKGDVAAFLCTNRAEIIEIYSALAKTGVIGLPLNYRLAPAEMMDLMIHCEAKSFLFDPLFGELAGKVKDNLPSVKRFVGLGETVPPFAVNYEELISQSSAAEPQVEISEEDFQYMNLTSGTTGLPKSYLLTQYNNTSAISMLGMLHDLTSDDVMLTTFPIFGRVGFAWSGGSFFHGARHVIMNFNPQQALELIQSERVTISNWVPTMASMILAVPNLESYDLSSLRGLVFAGAPLPPSLREEVRRRLCPNIYEYYGLQETGVLVALGPREKDRKPDSVGQIIPFSEVRLVDPTGQDVPLGSMGEVIGRAPTATAAYYKNEEKTRETFRDGWFYTGDLGRFDEEGFLYLTGRSKDMIISGGQNVFAVEVENAIMSHPAVADCAVIGLLDQKWGELVTAAVIRAAGAHLTEEELIQYCKERIAGFKTPKRIVWLDEALPRTPTGKVKKFLLVEKYAQG